MFKVVADLMVHKQLTFEEGAIQLFGQYGGMLPIENLVGMQKLIDNAKEEYGLYLVSKDVGKKWIKAILNAHKMDKIKDQAKWGENTFTLAGLGKMKVSHWDAEKKEMIYKIENSRIAEEYGNVGRAVDHIARGWFAGAACIFFGADVDAVETKCIAKGDKYCEFIIKPKKDFDFTVPIVSEQLKK